MWRALFVVMLALSSASQGDVNGEAAVAAEAVVGDNKTDSERPLAEATSAERVVEAVNERPGAESSVDKTKLEEHVAEDAKIETTSPETEAVEEEEEEEEEEGDHVFVPCKELSRLNLQTQKYDTWCIPLPTWDPLKAVYKDEGLGDYKPGGFHPVAIGDKLSQYTVKGRVARGTFATVWAVEADTAYNADIAPNGLVVKIMKVIRTSSHVHDFSFDFSFDFLR